MYNHTSKNKRFRIKNGGRFFVECDGQFHGFNINMNRYYSSEIQTNRWEPGAKGNGIKINKKCILVISSGSGSGAEIGRFKVCPSRHAEKLCIFNLKKV